MQLSKNQLNYLKNLLQKENTKELTKSKLCIHDELTKKINIELENQEKDFIKKLTIIKDKNKISYDKLAEFTDISKNTLQNVIKGNFTKLTRGTKKKIKLFICEFERGKFNNEK